METLKMPRKYNVSEGTVSDSARERYIKTNAAIKLQCARMLHKIGCCQKAAMCENTMQK